MSFRCHGLRIGVRVDPPALIERLPACLPPGSARLDSPRVEQLYSLRQAPPSPRRGVRHYHLLFAGGALAGRSRRLEELFASLASELDYFVASHARRRIFVHAGAVAWRGRAIVIPGKSGTGKTTLVAALAAAGARVLSDEYAVFDRRGRVHPYLRAPAAGDAPKGRRPPLEVGAVVATGYRRDARWRPRRLSPGRAVLELLAHTVAARRRSERALESLRAAMSSAVGFKGIRGEASDLAPRLLERMPWPG